MGKLQLTKDFSMYYPEGYDKRDNYGTDLLEKNLYHGVNLLNYIDFKDAILIDAGAYVGWFTEWAIRQGVSTAIAFEPDMSNFECLRKNMLHCNWNNRADVELYPFAIHDQTATLFMDGIGQQVVTGEEDTGEGKNTIGVPLDLMFWRDRVFNPDSHLILKMDIEGNETHGIVGAIQLLQGHKKSTVIACTYHYDDQFTEVKKAINMLDANTVSIERGVINLNPALLLARITRRDNK